MNHEIHERYKPRITKKSKPREPHEKIFYKEEVHAIQGCIFEVYREMGCGFLEAVYQECLKKEFFAHGIPFQLQKELILTYKGQPLEQRYKPDFICFEKSSLN